MTKTIGRLYTYNNYVTIISYEPLVPYIMLCLVLAMGVIGYTISLLLSLCAAPVFIAIFCQAYLLVATEHLYLSLLLFIYAEVMLFASYFVWIYHNYSYSGPLSLSNFIEGGIYYLVAGLLLSLLSFYLSLTPIILFIIISFLEFNNVLDITYINDNPIISLELTIVTLHLLHLVVGLIFILCEVNYPYYYHFIEVIWLLIGYVIYLH